MSRKRNPLRVLSIDFDYFQKISSADILADYPDGVDLPTFLASTIWISHYANPRTKEVLLGVEADHEGLKQIREILSNSKKTKKDVMMVQSHKLIYDFIMDNYNGGDYDSVEVVNVDMHHDMFNNGDEVDCGNWATHILQDIENCKVTWIANPISVEAYGTKPALEGNTFYDLSVLKDKQFDLIFICRSDSWLPPHLDKEFEKLYYFVLEEFGGAMVDSQVTECREWEEAAEQMSKIYQQCYDYNSKLRGKQDAE